jgi:CubicO group peptidase (beta-lactamase class C family)
MKKHVCFILLLVAVVSSPIDHPAAVEPTDTPLAKRIDAFLSPYYSADEPGISVIATRNGEIIFRKGYGSANIELGVPIEPHMVFRIASITKEFTAVLIMQLVEQGKISLDDDITKYLPDYPTQGHTVTIAHLLSHTSGIIHFTQLQAFQDNIRQDHTPQEVIDVFKNEPFQFEPGERYSYSNSGYILLGVILEKVEGKSYEQLLRDNIFDPLGMNSAGRGGNDKIIPGRVNGYTRLDGVLVNDAIVTMTAAFSAGSLVMSIDDLAKWDEALYTNQLLNDASKELMWTPYILNDGKEIGYGLGWKLRSFLDNRIISHSGSIDGFTSQAYRVPDSHVFVAVFANSDAPETSVTFLVKSILALILEIPEKKAIELSDASLMGYTGGYKRKDDRIWNVILEDGTLYLAPNERFKQELIPESETSFFMPDAFHIVSFDIDRKGNVLKLKFIMDDGGTIEAVKE